MFREKVPFVGCLRREDRASQTRLTGKIILCKKSMNLSLTIGIFFFLGFLLSLSGTQILLSPARLIDEDVDDDELDL